VFFQNSLPRSLGFTATARGHITGIIVFSLFMVIASATLLTYVAVLFFILAMPVAVLRLIPAVNAAWPLSPAAWPFWWVRR
jgi:hypothetical protein